MTKSRGPGTQLRGTPEDNLVRIGVFIIFDTEIMGQ